MISENDFEVEKLRNSRFPSAFFIYIRNKNIAKKEFISTIQHSASETKYTGIKPDDVPEFLHAKLCLIACGQFTNGISEEERLDFFKSDKDVIEVGTIRVGTSGLFLLIVDNKEERIFLKEVLVDNK